MTTAATDGLTDRRWKSESQIKGAGKASSYRGGGEEEQIVCESGGKHDRVFSVRTGD